ncbi:MAG: hypothetical protein KDB82_05185 [Planctomycetes bacterium]|nr:hypothetical protein [Planctomycetota bacterium]
MGEKSDKNPFGKLEAGTRVTFVIGDAVITGLFLEGRDKWIRIGEPKATGEGAVASALEASEAWINARKLSAVWW